MYGICVCVSVCGGVKDRKKKRKKLEEEKLSDGRIRGRRAENIKEQKK